MAMHPCHPPSTPTCRIRRSRRGIALVARGSTIDRTAQSLANVVVHLVFSTKLRTPWLGDKAMRVQLHAYMATILRDCVDSPALVIGGVEDHVHALLLL